MAMCPLLAIAANSAHPEVQAWITDYYCLEDNCAWWVKYSETNIHGSKGSCAIAEIGNNS